MPKQSSPDSDSCPSSPKHPATVSIPACTASHHTYHHPALTASTYKHFSHPLNSPICTLHSVSLISCMPDPTSNCITSNSRTKHSSTSRTAVLGHPLLVIYEHYIKKHSHFQPTTLSHLLSQASVCACVCVDVSEQVLICAFLLSLQKNVESSMSPKSQRMERKSGRNLNKYGSNTDELLRELFDARPIMSLFDCDDRKNWTSSWTVLQGSSLLFAKGQGGSTSWVRIPSSTGGSCSFCSIPFISVLFLSPLFLHSHLSSLLPVIPLPSPPFLPEVLLPQWLHPRAALHSP